jgi:membrane fusion protein, multidrug efflux system
MRVAATSTRVRVRGMARSSLIKSDGVERLGWSTPLCCAPYDCSSPPALPSRVEFQVQGYGDQTFEGHIERISPVADPATRQVPIFVSISNTAGRLVAGLFAEGHVNTEARPALVAPANAVESSGSGAWVLRVRDGKAERVSVQIGLRDERNARVELRSGVSEGDVLLTGAAQAVTPGTPVKIGPDGEASARRD